MQAYDEELGLLTSGDEESEADTEAIADPDALPIHSRSPVSGLYARPNVKAKAAPAFPLGPAPPGIRPIRKEEIRLDVDGRYPQMMVSGTISGFLVARIHWIARLTAIGANKWSGAIWYKDGAAASFPYTAVEVTAHGSPFPNHRSVKIKFSGVGVPKRTVVYRFRSKYFRTVNFEFDFQQGEIADTEIDSCAHPNRPASLPCETLTIPKVFRRLGCQVTANAGSSPVPAPPGATWSDMEMHDAMQIHWSRFANAAQWAMWVFYASLHEVGMTRGGIMFDDIGPNHRQGTALFVDSFIAQPPAGDPNPAAWIDRMRFWTAVHEMGHGFNLAHSWQKSLGAPFGTPWVPLADEPEARSFMNYPYNVDDGQAAFFADFEFRFSDQELVFIRHAPERFVQMGNAAWFDHHGFEEAAVPAEPTLQLELRVNRERARYEFMEPVWLELKLKNVGDQPRLVDADVLDADSLTVILKKQGKEARQLIPFRQKCTQPVTKALMPGDSIYGTVLASAGVNGWDVAEPGTYKIQAAAHVGDEDVVSAPLDLRIAPPNSRDEEYIAGDLFDQGPARVLTLGGSGGGIPFLEGANDVLQEIVERFPERRISLHARVALGNPRTIDYKTVLPTDDLQDVEVVISKADPDAATDLIEPVLVDEAQTALETLGHIRYRTIAERTAKRLEAAGADAAAATTLDSAIEALAARKVDGRPIKPEVIEDLKETRKELAPKSKAKPRAKAKA
jgi:hypothetical protein